MKKLSLYFMITVFSFSIFPMEAMAIEKNASTVASNPKEVPAEVELVYQPKYKPDIAVETFEQGAEGVLPVRKSIRRADVLTTRTGRTMAGSIYTYKSSRFKPLKSAVVYSAKATSKGYSVAKNILSGMGRRGQLALGSQFETIEKPILIQSQKPRARFTKPSRQPAISGAQAELLFKSQGRRTPSFAMAQYRQPLQPREEIKRIYRPFSRNLIDSRTYARARIESRQQPRARETTRNLSREFARGRARERAREVTRFNEKIMSRVQEKALEKTLQRTQQRTRGGLSPIRMQPPRPPRTPPPYLYRDSRGKSAQPRQERGYDYFYREFKVGRLQLDSPKKMNKRLRRVMA